MPGCPSVSAGPVQGRLNRLGDVLEGQVNDLLQAVALQVADDGRQLAAAVEVLAAVLVAAGRDQDLRLELAEPVEHAPPAEVRRHARPDRPDARRGEHRDDGLGDVRQHGRDPVAGLDAHVPEPGREDPHRGREVIPVQGRDWGRLGLVVQRHLARPLVAQHVLGVVEGGAGEPLGARHLATAEDGGGLGSAVDVVIVPDRPPEGVDVSDRPLPQVGVRAEVQAPGVLQPPREGGDAGLLDPLRGGRPQQVAGLDVGGQRIQGHTGESGTGHIPKQWKCGRFTPDRSWSGAQHRVPGSPWQPAMCDIRRCDGCVPCHECALTR